MQPPKEFRILHLSDLHFGGGKKKGYPSPESCINTLGRGLIKSGFLPIDLVVITGDIAHKGNSPEGFKKAQRSLKDLMRKLNLGPRHFFFVPGNHDVNCSDKSITGKHRKRFNNYKRFVNGFFGKDPRSPRIEWFEDVRFPDRTGADNMDTAIALHSPLPEVDFLIMNSVWNYNYKRKVNISIGRKEINYFKKLSCALKRQNSLKIALMHNSPIELHCEAQKSIRKSGKLLSMFDECGVSLVLHGDMHNSQHVSAARDLDLRPLYILGAGRVNPGLAGVPHFHILNITYWMKLGSAEVEVLSFNIDGKNIILQNPMCYDLYTPLKQTPEAEASIHIFELPEPNRDSYRYRIGKDLLFAFRAGTFRFLKKTCTSLLTTGKADFQPDRMYSLFYQSMFKCGQERNIFRAVHDHDWRTWLYNSSSRDILQDHYKCAKNNGIDIERIIILKNEEVEKIADRIKNDDIKDVKDLVQLAKLMKEKWVEKGANGGCFRTFIVREKDIKYYEYVKKSQSGYDIDSEIKRISPGNIALFAKAKTVKKANEKNALAFYYEEKEAGQIFGANLSINKSIIEEIKKYIEKLWQEKSRRDCRSLTELDQMINFIQKGVNKK